MAHEIESPKLSFPDDNEAEGKISLEINLKCYREKTIIDGLNNAHI